MICHAETRLILWLILRRNTEAFETKTIALNAEAWSSSDFFLSRKRYRGFFQGWCSCRFFWTNWKTSSHFPSGQSHKQLYLNLFLGVLVFVDDIERYCVNRRWNLHTCEMKNNIKNIKKQKLARGSNPRPYKTTLYNKGLWSQKGGMLVGHDSKSQKGVVLYRLTC